MRTIASLGAAAALLVATLVSKPVTADAEASLWSAIGPYVPQDAKAVLYVDGASLKSSAIAKRFKQKLFAQGRGLANRIEETCKLDLEASVANAVVVITKDEAPNFYVETQGLGLERIKSCIKDLAAREDDQATFVQKGQIVQVSVGKSQKIYFGWLNNRILVTADELDDRDKLNRAVSRAKKRFDKRTEAVALLARLDRSATAWGVYVDAPASRNSEKPERAFGSLSLNADQVAAEAHAFFSSSEVAASASKQLNKELSEAKRDAAKNDKLGPVLSRILAAVKITTTGNEVVGNATASQSDAIEAIEAASERK